MPKPPHLILYVNANEKTRLTRLAHSLGVSYSELLSLLVWPMARRVEAALKRGHKPAAVLAALRRK